MEKVRIFIYTTYISICSDHKGNLTEAVGQIRDVLDLLREIIYIPRFRRYQVKSRYYLYDNDSLQMRLPRHMLIYLEDCLKSQNISFEYIYEPSIEPRHIEINITSDWTDRPEQIKSITHLSNNTLPMRACDLQPGKGKSYSAIRVIETIKNPTLLICGGLVEQWVREFEIKTDIDPSEIYVIKGAGSIVKLLNSDYIPTIFIASIDTLRAYVAAKELPYSDILSYSEFLEKYNIGIKVVDEFHLNFNTIVNIDLCSNVANNLYLSATPKRSSGTEKEIFKRIFPIDIIDGGEGYDRYVNVSLYRYNLEYPKESMFNTQHGYSHSKYESYILNNGKVRQRFVDQILFPLINSHYINKKTTGQKLLVFCRTVAFCELLRDYISTKYPKLDVRTYTQTDSECNLEESDVIVSTPQSCGTGKDIANLRTVIQTCSIGSEPLVEQILGRLRKLPNGDTPEFVDIMNAKLGRHWAHYRSRAKIYKERAFRYNEFNLC